MLYKSFLGVTTIGAHHSVGCVTGAMIPCSLKGFKFSFPLVSICKGYRSRHLDAKGLCVIGQGDVELFPFHGFDLSIKH